MLPLLRATEIRTVHFRLDVASVFSIIALSNNLIISSEIISGFSKSRRIFCMNSGVIFIAFTCSYLRRDNVLLSFIRITSIWYLLII